MDKVFLFLLLVVLTTSCQSVLPGSEATATPDPRALILSDGESPYFIDSQGSLPDKPGLYLVYSEFFSEHAGEIKYVSDDSEVTGDLLSYSNIEQYGIWLPNMYMSAINETPQLIFSDYFYSKHTVDLDGGVNLWVTDRVGNPLRNWNIEATPDTGVVCNDPPSFSPSSRRVAIICDDALNHYYINLIDMKSGEQRIISVPGTVTIIPAENWSRDETQFYTWDNTYSYCFISISKNNALCKDVGKPILSISPDWKHVVLFSGKLPFNPDLNLSGAQIQVVDMECLMGQSSCDNGTEFNLFYTDDGQSNTNPSLSLHWNPTGKFLAWMATPLSNYQPLTGYISGNPSCGWIDLSEKTNLMLCDHVIENTSMLGIAPNDNWLLLSDRQGLYLLSIKEQMSRRLVTPISEFGSIRFYGWFTVP